MSDIYKKMSDGECGPGGWKCPCCGPAPGEDRKKHRRLIRRRMAQELQDEIEAQLEEAEADAEATNLEE